MTLLDGRFGQSNMQSKCSFLGLATSPRDLVHFDSCQLDKNYYIIITHPVGAPEHLSMSAVGGVVSDIARDSDRLLALVALTIGKPHTDLPGLVFGPRCSHLRNLQASSTCS